MKIAYITTDWANSEHREKHNEYGGVGYYRAIKPAEELRKLGFDVDVFGSDFKDQIKGKNLFDGYAKWSMKYDRVIIKQADNRFIAQLIGACHYTGTPIIMDLDDNFLEVFKGQPALEKGYDKSGDKRAYASAAMSMVDALFVSTEPLKDDFSQFLKNQFNQDMPIYVLPNCNDVKDWDFTTTASDSFIIGWHGSITHDEDLKIVLPVIKEIMEENDDVYLQLMGGVRQESIPDLFKGWEDIAERILIVGGTPSWHGFPELLMQMPFDVAIAPLVDNKFNRCKSHIKWMENAMRKTPTIASNVEPYKVIDHKKTGYLCDTPNDFKKWILKLMKDKELREEIGENAYNEVVQNWQYEDNIDKWVQSLNNVSKRPENAPQGV